LKDIALIDNDFIQHLTKVEYGDEEQWKDLIDRLFKALDYSLAFHELLYRNEVLDEGTSSIVKRRVLGLIKEEKVFIESISIIKKDTSKTEYYKIVFEEICNDILGKKPVDDIFKDWKRGKSLGEIHSLSMCVVCNYKLFLSDDDDSKKIRSFLKRKFVENSICVYNRDECLDMAIENGASFKRLEKRILKRSFSGDNG